MIERADRFTITANRNAKEISHQQTSSHSLFSAIKFVTMRSYVAQTLAMVFILFELKKMELQKL